ncbi:anti-sigma factor [Chroococcus sp. FPU101]|uniref:anti-sigma factor family protein n=1 Tax=Chroococcus sp. FPU101 TaxID=1974212 RepID=UPI001A8E1034|nr:anti-sigma factor [Chroococcus sp. FPU101]GFE70580.1 putative transmembrane anti-sigma factor [Chroococcus sp. FPU101]
MKEFESLKHQSLPNPNQSEDPPETLADTSLLDSFDAVSMERFELLSAYLDGEVTAVERRQVQQWLDTDPSFQKLYRKLTKLQQSAQYAPTPIDAHKNEQLSAQVFQKLDRRRNQRLLALSSALGAAIAMACVFYLFPGRSSFNHQIAHNQLSVSEVDDEELMIALNHPPFDFGVSDGDIQHNQP